MIFGGVRLPDELRIARDKDRLVVFAGAGVSCAPPSNLPLFNGLARQICGGTVVTPGREDRVLGKLSTSGTDVHSAAAQILYGKHSHFTSLHIEILRLFGEPQQVRVVTTNFDDHFSTAAQQLFRGRQLNEFCAPALPLGDDFTGLVYLHGSARFDPRTIVLTDRDFGAAYLTRGWARDFLVPLFSRYTVLFVGYSHSDVTITYLARGLNQSATKPRWSLIPSNTLPEGRENWEHLEISLVEYALDQNHSLNAHHALPDFFAEWAKHTQETLISRAKRIKLIARGLPPESLAVSDYIQECFNHQRLAEDFCSEIRHPAWIGWMDDQGYFKPLFNQGQSSEVADEIQRVLARWLSSFVRRRYPQLLLALLERRGQRLSPLFSQCFAQVLSSEHSKKPDSRFATWISILLASSSADLHEQFLLYLLADCPLPKAAGVALHLFELLTAPCIRVERTWDFSSTSTESSDGSRPAKTKLEYAIVWRATSTHGLSDVWPKVFQPHLATIGEALVQIISKQLTQAHLLLCGVRAGSKGYDQLSWGRNSIAPDEQNDNPSDECLSCLIDFLRDALLYWIESNPARARIQTELMWRSNVPLLKRFAVYARSVDHQYGADERIEWLLNQHLIFQWGMKKEVFDVLAQAYPNASIVTRKLLLRGIKKGLVGPRSKTLDPRTVAYEIFNVLVWLRRHCPDCTLIQTAIMEVRNRHPEFEEREYPQFDYWHSHAEFVEPHKGIRFDEILSELPERHLKAIRGARGEPSLIELFRRDMDWARRFVDILVRESETDAQIWRAVFSAWRETIKDAGDWDWALSIIGRLPREAEIYASAANLITHAPFSHDANLGDNTLNAAAMIMDTAWELCSKDEEVIDDKYRSWLTSAINHVGGWIGQFWVHYCNRLRNRSRAEWEGIPASIRLKMQDALQGTTRVKVYARIALTPWIGYLFAWDRSFAVTHLLPLLDWTRDAVVAQQSWSVLLNYNRGTTADLEDQLIPYYRQYADRLTSMLKSATEKSEQFDAHTLESLGHSLARLAMQVIPNPIESGFFRDFLPILPDKVLAGLAKGMGDLLEQMVDQKREDLWSAWLRHYLDLRLIGTPAVLSTFETREMLRWCFHLGPFFAEAVDRISKMPQKSVFAFGVIKDLAGGSHIDAFPIHACRLAVSALKGEEHPHIYEALLTLLRKFRVTIPGTAELREYEELLYLRGWKEF